MTTMILLLILMSGQDTSAKDALDRYAALRKSSPDYVASYTTGTGDGTVTARMTTRGRTELLLECKGKDLDYAASFNPTTITELDHVAREYDENLGDETIQPHSRMTGIFSTFPGWMYVPDLRKLLPKDAAFQRVGTETDDATTCDHLHTHFVVQMSKVDIDVAIDQTGRIHRYHSVAVSPMGGADQEWRISSYQPVSHPSPSLFNLALPTGYVPYALPELDGPISTGRTFPAQGWKDRGGRPVDIVAKLGSRGGLVAILGVDSEPSSRARVSLDRLRSAMPVTIVSDGDAHNAIADAYDPGGKLLQKVSPPSTPLFIMLDASGIVRHLWMGYDADSQAEFEADVRNAFAAK